MRSPKIEMEKQSMKQILYAYTVRSLSIYRLYQTWYYLYNKAHYRGFDIILEWKKKSSEECCNIERILCWYSVVVISYLVGYSNFVSLVALTSYMSYVCKLMVELFPGKMLNKSYVLAEFLVFNYEASISNLVENFHIKTSSC